MPVVSYFRGIRVYFYGDDHNPPHFHAMYGGQEVMISISELEIIEGGIPSKQLKMLLGWAAFHQDELLENWQLMKAGQPPFKIEPLR